jgi:hypothetical protein
MVVDENPHRWRIRSHADWLRWDLTPSQRRGLHRKRKLDKRTEARMEVKTYLEDEETFILEEGTCSCGIEPQDLEESDFIYVRIGDLGMPACRDCHKLLPAKELM